MTGKMANRQCSVLADPTSQQHWPLLVRLPLEQRSPVDLPEATFTHPQALLSPWPAFSATLAGSSHRPLNVTVPKSLLSATGIIQCHGFMHYPDFPAELQTLWLPSQHVWDLTWHLKLRMSRPELLHLPAPSLSWPHLPAFLVLQSGTAILLAAQV